MKKDPGICTDSPEFTINFDDDGGELSVRYQKMEGDFESRIQGISKRRWQVASMRSAFTLMGKSLGAKICRKITIAFLTYD